MLEWFENESFWKETYDFLFPEKLFMDTRDQIEKILQLVDVRGSCVLDLCCGPGRFSILLAERGFAVTGVDRSPFLLDQAKMIEKSTDSPIDMIPVEWVLEDMRRFVRPSSYDLVLNMFTSFGYFEDKNEDLTVLENIFTSLKPGGTLLIDIMGKEILARIFQSSISTVLDDGTVVVQRPEIFDNWSRIRNDWTIIRGSRATTFTFQHNIYSGQELKDRMSDAGFESIKLYGDLNGDPYDISAKRLVITGIKPFGTMS